MRLLRIDQAGIRSTDTVFKEPVETAIALTAGMLGIGLFLIWLGWKEGDVFMALLSLIVLGPGAVIADILRKALKPTNWVMTIGHDRVMLKFRPYAHTRFSEQDPQVAEIPMSEVVSVARRTVAVTDRGHKGRIHTVREPFVELRLRGADLAPLRERLRHERTHPNVIATHHPVSTTGNDVVRVSWRGTAAWLRPKPEEALRLLGERVPVEPETTTHIDLTRPESISPADREWYLRSLAKSGTNIRAVLLTEKLYGVSNQEAKRMLAEWEMS
jgi:hypothetical protein